MAIEKVFRLLFECLRFDRCELDRALGKVGTVYLASGTISFQNCSAASPGRDLLLLQAHAADLHWGLTQIECKICESTTGVVRAAEQ